MKQRHAPVRDARFARVQTDPRFRRPKRSDTKVTVDERFRDVLKPENQDDDLPIDRFGRRKSRIAKRSDDDLSAYYQMEGEGAADLARGAVELESSSEESSDEEDEDEDEEDEDEEDEDEDEEEEEEDVEEEDEEEEDDDDEDVDEDEDDDLDA